MAVLSENKDSILESVSITSSDLGEKNYFCVADYTWIQRNYVLKPSKTIATKIFLLQFFYFISVTREKWKDKLQPREGWIITNPNFKESELMRFPGIFSS